MNARGTTQRRLTIVAIIVTVLGLALTLGLLFWVGWGPVAGVLARVSLPGFVLYCGWTGVILIGLGIAWHMVAPGEPLARLPAFIWARTTREAATDVLPFSQFGGIIVGARTLVTGGVPQPMVYASLVADQTTELAAQLVYTAYGVAALALVLGAAPGQEALRTTAFAGLGLSAAVIAAFIFAQRPMIGFAIRLAEAVLPAAASGLASMRDTLTMIYARYGRVSASFGLHILTWVGSGAGAWFGLKLLGVDLPITSVIVIESVIFTLRTAAFLVPGAIGLQEGAYVLLAPVFGLPAEAALALSLLKRGRDLAIGVPAMLVWQLGEANRLVRSR